MADRYPRQMKAILATAVVACFLCVGSGCKTGGQPWTIECLELHGEERTQNAEAVAEALRGAGGLNADRVSVTHDDERSVIYYGRYDRRIDRARGERKIPEQLREDLEHIKELMDDRGRRLFLGARMVPVPWPDVGREAWNLENADGVYSLQVGAFESTPELPNFKEAALAFTTALRDTGYEAYYYHSEALSIVTVGSFGAEAVTDVNGITGYSHEVYELQEKESFQYNLTNGSIWHVNVDGARAPVRSLLVPIPKKDEFGS